MNQTFAKVIRRLGFGVACGGCGHGSLVRAKSLDGATCPRCNRDLSDATISAEPEPAAQVVPSAAQVNAAEFWRNRGCCRRLP